PRIHGELLKLGITISERTVWRYLRGRPTTRSQTWRTFLANHFAGQIAPVMFAEADHEHIVVDASDVSLYRAPSIDARHAALHGPTVASGRSLQPSSIDVSVGQQHFRDRIETRKSSGRAPPAHLPHDQPRGVRRRLTFGCGEQFPRAGCPLRVNSPACSTM